MRLTILRGLGSTTALWVVLATCGRTESLPSAQANDNRTPAGTLSGDTLRISLVARMGRWFPESDSGPFLEGAVFGEEGRAPQVPAPLIRVPVGTTIRASVRNQLDDTLLVVGLSGAQDTLRVAPSATESTETVVRSPGSFAYYAHTRTGGEIKRHGPGQQLFGALVVDSTATPGADRVLVLNSWDAILDNFVIMVNGRSWPFTERLTLNVGDTLRARVINGSDADHPMHLHGFYYQVVARGSWHSDTVFAAADRKLVVTEVLRPTQTMSMTWVPTRPGNWLFHCHDAFHIDGNQHDYLAGRKPPTTVPAHDAVQHATQDMAGLVIGINVHGEATVTEPSSAARRLRLVAQTRSDTLTPYAYATDSATVPGPVLELVRGERTAITVVNHLPVHTAVHWHGIELESYYDGVAGWSGSTARIAPLIAPNDSFVVVMTPPRAGTFIYHAHADDERQIPLGLAGPLIVTERSARRNPARDHIWLYSVAGIDDSALVVLNGARPLAPLRSGVEHRIRVINITAADMVTMELHDTDGIVRWRPIAKDGADLPRSQATERPARLQLQAGETWDFVWTPRRGRYELKVDSFNNFTVAVDVRE